MYLMVTMQVELLWGSQVEITLQSNLTFTVRVRKSHYSALMYCLTVVKFLYDVAFK